MITNFFYKVHLNKERGFEMLNDKKGASSGHVEMILSFVLFVGFLSAMLYFLNPTSSNELNKVFLENTKTALIKNWTSEYSIISLTISSDVILGISSHNCINVNQTIFGEVNAIAKNESGSKKEVEYQGKNMLIGFDENNRYYKIYISDFFELGSSLSNCKNLQKEDYSYGAPVVLEGVFLDLINKTFIDYANDYGKLKDSLNLKNDFAIYVYNSTKDLIMSTVSEPDTNIEVYSLEFPVLALNEKANKESLIINIRVW